MRRPTRWLLVLSLLSSLLVAGATAAPAHAATEPPVVSCDVAYQIDNDWGTGHQATVVVTNTGTVPVWWYVLIRYKLGFTVLQVWNIQATVAGDIVRFEPPSWNAQPLWPGQSATFGLVVHGPPQVPDVEVFCRPA